MAIRRRAQAGTMRSNDPMVFLKPGAELLEVALPAGAEGRRLFADEKRAESLVLARLMQQVENTLALHHCGETGLARLCRDGRRIGTLLLKGGNRHRC